MNCPACELTGGTYGRHLPDCQYYEAGQEEPFREGWDSPDDVYFPWRRPSESNGATEPRTKAGQMVVEWSPVMLKAVLAIEREATELAVGDALDDVQRIDQAETKP